jgi:hypothetical protein
MYSQSLPTPSCHFGSHLEALECARHIASVTRQFGGRPDRVERDGSGACTEHSGSDAGFYLIGVSAEYIKSVLRCGAGKGGWGWSAYGVVVWNSRARAARPAQSRKLSRGMCSAGRHLSAQPPVRKRPPGIGRLAGFPANNDAGVRTVGPWLQISDSHVKANLDGFEHGCHIANTG